MSQDTTPIAFARCEAERAALATERAALTQDEGATGIRDTARIGAIDSRLRGARRGPRPIHADPRRAEGRDGNPVRVAQPMASRGRDAAAESRAIDRSRPPRGGFGRAEPP